MDLTKFLKELSLQNLLILMLLGSISFFIMDSAFTFSLILGGIIITANFYFLQSITKSRIVSNGPIKIRKVAIIAKCYLRLAILGLILFILIGFFKVDPVALVIGLSIIFISIITMALRYCCKASVKEVA